MPAMGMANQIVVEAPGCRVMTGISRRMNTPTSRPTEPTAAAAMVGKSRRTERVKYHVTKAAMIGINSPCSMSMPRT